MDGCVDLFSHTVAMVVAKRESGSRADFFARELTAIATGKYKGKLRAIIADTYEGDDREYIINERNELYQTLFLAVTRGNKEAVMGALELGAGSNVETSLGYTPLIVAAVYGHGEIIQLLCDNGADINQANKDGDTPLLEAVAWGNTGAVMRALHCGQRVM